MPRYAVTASRTIVREYEFDVQADSEQEARDKVRECLALFDNTSRFDEPRTQWGVKGIRELADA